PLALRDHPQTGTQFIIGFHIKVMIKIAIALQQTEAAGIFISERGNTQGAMVAQWAPDPLTVGRCYQKTVGVVNFWTEVINEARRARTVVIKPSKRSDTHLLDIALRKQECFDAHLCRGAGRDFKTLRTSN